MSEMEAGGEIVLYTTEDGLANVQLRAVEGNAWPSLDQLAAIEKLGRDAE